MAGRALGSFATLLAVLACLGLPVAVTATWVRLQVQDTDHYVSAVTPLSDDPAVRAAVVEEVDHQINGTVVESAGPEIEAALPGLLATPAFAKIWATGNRAAHQQLIAVLEDDSQGDVDIGIDQLVSELTDSLGAGVIPPGVVVKTSLDLHLVSSEDLAHARSGYRVLDALWFWPAIGWAALALLALVLPGARRRVVSVLSIGSLLGLGLMAGVLMVARTQVTSLGSRAHGELVAAFWDALTHSLWVAMAALAILAALALVGRLVLGLTSPARARYES